MSTFSQRLHHIYQQHVDFDFFGFNEHSDFWNFGYWSKDTVNHKVACENLMERLLAFLPEKRGTILDVACGKGATTRYLLKYYRPECIVGINISSRQLEVCKRNAPSCNFREMDATKLEFEDNSFDNVICVEAAVHFDTRERFLSEAQRVVKTNGHLVLSDVLLAIRSPIQPKANYLRDPNEYNRMLVQAGFSDVQVLDVTEQCWGGFSRNLATYLEEKLLAREIDYHDFYQSMAWLHRSEASIRYYVLASCTKR